MLSTFENEVTLFLVEMCKMGHLGIGLRQRLSTWPFITKLSMLPELVG